MQATKKQTFRYVRQLLDDYFDMLDAEGVDYMIHDKADQEYIFSTVKDSYMVGPEEMALKLGYNSIDAYIEHRQREERSENLSINIEHQIGRFLFHYDGNDLTVHDIMHDQEIVMSVDYDQQTVAQMALGVINTFEKYQRALGGMQ